MIYKKFNRFQRTLAIATAAAIFLFYLFFNFNYLSKWIDEKGDCMTYDYYVKLGIPQFLFNPHHIGFDWLGERMYKTLKENGYTGKSMVVLQLRNLLISSLSLAVIFVLIYKISLKYFLSLLLIMCIQFTAAFWMYSQINDTPIIHSCMLAMLFLFAIAFPQVRHKKLYAMFLGMFHAVLIFFHQSDLIFMTVIAFIIFFANFFLNRFTNELTDDEIFANLTIYQKKDNIKIQHYPEIRLDNLKYFIIYLVTFAVIVVIAYYYVGFLLIGLTPNKAEAKTFNRIKEATYFFNWLILYTKIDAWGKGFSDMSTLEKVLTGISTYFYQPQSFDKKPLHYDFANFIAPNAFLPNLIGVLFIVVFCSTLIFCKKYNYIFIANLIFMVLYSVFTMWWEPDYREFWVAPMFSFWFLSFFVLNFFIDNVSQNFKLPLKTAIYLFMILLSLSLFYFNFTGFIYPNASHNFSKFEIMR